MLAPVPYVAPETPVCTTVQSKPAPNTLLVKEIDAVVPEHKLSEATEVVRIGSGFTLIVTMIGEPLQLLDVGVMA